VSNGLLLQTILVGSPIREVGTGSFAPGPVPRVGCSLNAPVSLKQLLSITFSAKTSFCRSKNLPWLVRRAQKSCPSTGIALVFFFALTPRRACSPQAFSSRVRSDPVMHPEGASAMNRCQISRCRAAGRRKSASGSPISALSLGSFSRIVKAAGVLLDGTTQLQQRRRLSRPRHFRNSSENCFMRPRCPPRSPHYRGRTPIRVSKKSKCKDSPPSHGRVLGEDSDSALGQRRGAYIWTASSKTGGSGQATRQSRYVNCGACGIRWRDLSHQRQSVLVRKRLVGNFELGNRSIEQPENSIDRSNAKQRHVAIYQYCSREAYWIASDPTAVGDDVGIDKNGRGERIRICLIAFRIFSPVRNRFILNTFRERTSHSFSTNLSGL
jgi:hypothetical protein